MTRSFPKAMLWDLDGVVIDSEFVRDEDTRHILAGYGKEYDRDRIKPLLAGKPSIDIARMLVEEYELPLSPEEFNAMRKERIHGLYRDSIGFVPGFLEFHQALPKLPEAVATGCDPEFFSLIDRRLGITDLFQGHVYSSALVKRHKPAPDIVIYAAWQLGVSPEECGYFEDAPNGIAAGISAGTPVIALTRTFTQDSLTCHTQQLIGRNITPKDVFFIPDYSQASRRQVLSFLQR